MTVLSANMRLQCTVLLLTFGTRPGSSAAADKLGAKLDELEALSSTLRGLDYGLARVSLQVGRLFASWSRRDAEDQNDALGSLTRLMTEQMEKGPHDYPTWQRWASILPGREAEDALMVAMSALAEAAEAKHSVLTEQRGGAEMASPEMASSPPPAQSWSLLGATIGVDGYYRSERGHVVFGHGYNKIDNYLLPNLGGEASKDALASLQASWAEGRGGEGAEAALDALAAEHEAELSMLHELGINQVVCHLNPARHLNPDLSLNASAGSISKCLLLLAMAARFPERAMRVVVLLKHDLPPWAYAKHPDLLASFAEGDAAFGREHATTSTWAQHDVAYDIDHPKAMVYMKAALVGAARLFGCHPGLDSWELGNEHRGSRNACMHSLCAHTHTASHVCARIHECTS